MSAAESSSLDKLFAGLESVSIQHLETGGNLAWVATGLAPTDRPVTQRFDSDLGAINISDHGSRTTIHVRCYGATRCLALAGAAHLWERHDELLARSAEEVSQ